MKIALLSKYSQLAASSRYRFFQYESFLEKKGISLIKKPLFDDRYLSHLYLYNKRNFYYVIYSYIKRIIWLFSKPDIDLIWLHCDLFPYMPGFVERLVNVVGKPIIYDYDDAIFHNYDSSSKWFVKKFLGNKLHTTIKNSSLAICGNDYLANYARPLCSNIEIVPTVLNTKIYYPRNKKEFEIKSLKIGWIGTPTTFKLYLKSKIPILQKLAKDENCQISIMGAGESNKFLYPSIEFLEWREENEIPFIQSLDIGIMPLNKSPWAYGKCGFKLIQYMACGVSVVATPIGINKSIIENEVNGLFAETDNEWYSKLKKLLNDKDLRNHLGFLGRKKIENEYSLKYWGPKVTNMILKIYTDSLGKF